MQKGWISVRGMSTLRYYDARNQYVRNAAAYQKKQRKQIVLAVDAVRMELAIAECGKRSRKTRTQVSFDASAVGVMRV